MNELFAYFYYFGHQVLPRAIEMISKGNPSESSDASDKTTKQYLPVVLFQINFKLSNRKKKENQNEDILLRISASSESAANLKC